MDPQLDELYLAWLYARIGSVEETQKSRTYWTLFRKLYFTEFLWFVPNDDNRVEDGRDLRVRFIDEMNVQNAEASWMRLGCSVLELLISLAQEMAFEADRTPHYWFWELMQNLGIHYLTDAIFKTKKHEEDVDDKVHTMVTRGYQPDGQGGLFPLQYPDRDQREVELWYQMSFYIVERV